MEDFLGCEHHDGTDEREGESIECRGMVLVWVFTEECIEVRFPEVHGSSEEESDHKGKSLNDRIEFKSLCQAQKCRESENNDNKSSCHDEK